MSEPAWRQGLRRWHDDEGGDWLVPAVASAVWAALLGAQLEAGTGLRRSLVAIGGPAVLLSGVHVRLTPYLHAAARHRLIALPIAPREHFAAALAEHRETRARALGLATVAVLAPHLGALDRVALGLVGDWLVLAIVAAWIEPAIAAASAWLGRRFPPESTPHRLQVGLGAGWTLPEAVVHLYAPALGLGVAMGLALPAQLVLDVIVDGRTPPMPIVVIAGVGIVLAAVLRAAAPFVYGLGMFEAVPFLAEATRTLAGPAIPEPAPRWVERIRDPVLRLLVLQFHRLTPVPVLRLLVLAAATVFAVRTASGSGLAVLAAAVMLWLVPARVLARGGAARRRLLAALPVPHRDGRHPWAVVLLVLPPAIAAIALVLPWGLAS